MLQREFYRKTTQRAAVGILVPLVFIMLSGCAAMSVHDEGEWRDSIPLIALDPGEYPY